MLRLGTIARCIWHGDVGLYNSLLDKVDEQGKKMYLDYMTMENGIPKLREPQKFEVDFRFAKNASLNTEAASIVAEHKSNSILQQSKKKSKLEANHRKQLLWTERAPTPAQPGVRLSDQEVAAVMPSSTVRGNDDDILRDCEAQNPTGVQPGPAPSGYTPPAVPGHPFQPTGVQPVPATSGYTPLEDYRANILRDSDGNQLATGNLYFKAVAQHWGHVFKIQNF